MVELIFRRPFILSRSLKRYLHFMIKVIITDRNNNNNNNISLLGILIYL